RDHFEDMLRRHVQRELIGRHAIFIPNRSFEVYLRERHSYGEIETGMLAPFFGSRALRRAEERGEHDNQYTLLDNAGIRYPKRLAGPDEIDGLTIVKAPHAKVAFERAFFLSASAKHYHARAADL